MQRKNSILKDGRGGFAMIMAIAVIVVISTIMALSLALTTQTAKKTNDLYLYEQSVLLSKSATEYALLRISQAQPCSISNLNFTQDTIYDVNISMRYVYDSNASCIANGGTLYTTVTTPEQNGSVIMDVTVGIDDPTIVSEPIKFFRRTMQKL